MHPAVCVSYPPPSFPAATDTLQPRGASLGFRSFSALGSGAEVGGCREKAAGGGEATPGGKELGWVRQVPPTSLGWGTYQVIYPYLVSNSAEQQDVSDTGCTETSPSSGWGLQKLEEAWNV